MESGAHPIRVEDWDALVVPDGYVFEIVQGELIVTRAANISRGRAVTRLANVLAQFCPAELELMMGLEWRVAQGGIVTMAPVPDVVVISVDTEGKWLTEPPVLAIEVLSPSDRPRLANGLSCREGKLADYADAGLADYLEIDLAGTRFSSVTRYENHDGTLILVDQKLGDRTLVADRPFPYELRPTDLLTLVS